MERKQLKNQEERKKLCDKVVNHVDYCLMERKTRMARNPVTGDGVECRDSYVFKKRDIKREPNRIMGDVCGVPMDFGPRNKPLIDFEIKNIDESVADTIPVETTTTEMKKDATPE